MRIAVASDHAGFRLKQHVVERLRASGHQVEDHGAYDERPTDYPDVARPAARAVAYGHADRAVLVDGGAGVAMSMVANRMRFVRAAVCHAAAVAESARSHNDANVLCLGAATVDAASAGPILDAFLGTPFAGGRHDRRVAKIDG